jgi:hypothetical protein
MATCPNCGLRSRDEPDVMVVEEVLTAKPVGSFSLAGAQMKFSATKSLRLRCRCGWSILGRIEGDSFIADPETETKP